jgi:hypothetical protein
MEVQMNEKIVHIIHAEHIKTGVKYTIKKACLPIEDSALDCSSKDGYESVKNESKISLIL